MINNWGESEDESDEIDDEEMLKLCQEFSLQHMAEEIIGLNRASRTNKRLSQPRKHFVILKIDEFVGFIVDAYVAQLIMSIRQKFQVKRH